jgi:aerobic-type carbon monoxide dehydrogenase small subunit (CoxS/CutS family)
MRSPRMRAVNLCDSTGYKKILTEVREAAKEMRS